MADGNKKWYALRAISGKETKVMEMLEAARKNDPLLEKSISQVLVPTEKVYTTRAGKKVLKERNLLPGYVEFPSEHIERYRLRAFPQHGKEAGAGA